MGQVFLALHRRMDRQVAIKFLPLELAQDDALVKRFHREAQVAARLTHPNIVTAYDAGARHLKCRQWCQGFREVPILVPVNVPRTEHGATIPDGDLLNRPHSFCLATQEFNVLQPSGEHSGCRNFGKRIQNR